MYRKNWGNIPPATFTADPSVKGAETGRWRAIRPVVNDACTGCGLCVTYCPDGCVELAEKKAVFDLDYCKGCGICAEECPVDAIEMEREA